MKPRAPAPRDPAPSALAPAASAPARSLRLLGPPWTASAPPPLAPRVHAGACAVRFSEGCPRRGRAARGPQARALSPRPGAAALFPQGCSTALGRFPG